MKQKRESAKDLTDEGVLADFVKKFECDGAILIYKDGEMEHGFLRWVNNEGRDWVNEVKSAIRNRKKS